MVLSINDAFMNFIEKNDIEHAKKYLQNIDQLKFDINHKCPLFTPLTYASSSGFIEIVELLLKHCADVNFVDNNGDTALLCASSQNYINIVKILLKHGADPNYKDHDGNTALIYSVIYYNIEIVGLLLENGANIKCTNNFGYNPLLYASKFGYTCILKLLLAYDININNQDIANILVEDSKYLNLIINIHVNYWKILKKEKM